MPTFLQDATILLALTGLIGLFVGSFLNVVIHRLPVMMEREWAEQAADLRGEPTPPGPHLNLATPRSRCPHCGNAIRPLDNIPIVSYLLLRGRCRHCKAAISGRYPLIELATAVLSGVAAWKFGYSMATLGALVFIWAMLALAFIDLDTQLLPDSITLPLIWVGLLFNLGEVFTTLPNAVIGAVAGYMTLWLVFQLFRLVTGKEGMGYGDFKLLAAVGAWLGWQMLPLTILLSSVVGAAVGIALIVFSRHKRSVPIPFGPYLAAAGLLALFLGETITARYMQML